MTNTDKRDLVARLQIPIDPHNDETVIPAWCIELMDEAAARILSDAKKIEEADELGNVVSNILAVDHPIDMTSKDYLERVHCALNTALEAYRKAGGDA